MNQPTNSPSHPTRRQFIGRGGAAALAILAGSRLHAASATSSDFLFLEAEGFDDHGGWELDQQSMDQMGSPYLLAHGLGIPVKDAVTQATFPAAHGQSISPTSLFQGGANTKAAACPARNPASTNSAAGSGNPATTRARSTTLN